MKESSNFEILSLGTAGQTLDLGSHWNFSNQTKLSLSNDPKLLAFAPNTQARSRDGSFSFASELLAFSSMNCELQRGHIT